MSRIPMDLLMYVLVLSAIMLFNYVSRRIAKWQARLEQEQQKQEKRRTQTQVLSAKPREERVAPPAGHTHRTPATASSAPGEALELPAAAARSLPEARSFLTGRRNLQRTIVGMTVLGPCRAQQPPHM